MAGQGGHPGCTPDSAAHAKPEHPASAARPWKADGYADRARDTDAVRHLSVDTAT
jgi:hypothetical protein